MKTQNTAVKSVFFVGGCAGTGCPPSARITCPSDTSAMPLSRPVARRVFGTHTTSFGLVSGDEGVFIDNGSGVGQAADFLLAEEVKKVSCLQTHIHQDHCNGITMNPLFMKKNFIQAIYCPILGPVTFRHEFDKYFEPQVWPVSPKMFGIEHNFVDFTPGAETLPVFGGVETMKVAHPGGAVAYSISVPEGKVVIATDCEWSKEDDRAAFAGFITGTRLLYIDVQYRDAEYEGKSSIGGGDTLFIRKNWGHSTPDMLEKVLLLMRVEDRPAKILVGHHDPKRSDEDLLKFEYEMRERFEKLGVDLSFARECQAIEIE